jgi:hypothetical protein
MRVSQKRIVRLADLLAVVGMAGDLNRAPDCFADARDSARFRPIPRRMEKPRLQMRQAAYLVWQNTAA